jgi:thioesterase domain-containing protein
VPPTELYVIHPGGVSASCWSRLASHLPPGTPVRIQELDTVNAYWSNDPALTVNAIADRLHSALRPAPRVLVGWGVGGAVAEALGARSTMRPRRVVALDGLAPGVRGEEPSEPDLLRSFAMYCGARRGRRLLVDPARLHDGLEPGLTHILDAAAAAGALRPDTTPATVRRCFDEHARRVQRDFRLTARHTPSGLPLTVVKAADSLAPEARALGWDRFGPTEVLAGAGDHYTMLTDPAAAPQLAMLLQRWLTPLYAAA